MIGRLGLWNFFGRVVVVDEEEVGVEVGEEVEILGVGDWVVV